MAIRPPALLIFAALALAACASPVAPSPPIGQRASVRHIVVAPLNLMIRTPAELQGKGEPVSQQLLEHFQTLDQQVSTISPASAEQLWLEATRDLDLSDRSRALETARSRFAKALALHRSYDLLVVPSLVLRSARMHGRQAYWDGVRRTVPRVSAMIGSRINFFQPTGDLWATGLRGEIGAASLHVAALGPDGTTVYEGLGGLNPIYEIRRDPLRDGRWKFELSKQPFAEPDGLREGVKQALAGTIPGDDSGLPSGYAARGRADLPQPPDPVGDALATEAPTPYPAAASR